MRRLLLAVLFTFAAAIPAQGAIIARWEFESLPDQMNSAAYGIIAATLGSGEALGQHASANTDWSFPVGNPGQAFSANTWAINDYFQFKVDTTGYQDITVSFDQMRSSTGPVDFVLAYSVDGSSFTSFASYTVGTSFSTNSYPTLASVSLLDNDSSIFFRLVATSAPGSAAGTSRVDNFTINGTPTVPEPASLLIFGSGFALLIACRVRRSTPAV